MLSCLCAAGVTSMMLCNEKTITIPCHILKSSQLQKGEILVPKILKFVLQIMLMLMFFYCIISIVRFKKLYNVKSKSTTKQS